MAKFTVRVELHNADESDYEPLHEAMQDKGFSRTIKNGDGIEYHLPTAEYNFSGSGTTQQVLNAAKEAAQTTDYDFEILVTESTSRRWYQLEPVHQN